MSTLLLVEALDKDVVLARSAVRADDPEDPTIFPLDLDDVTRSPLAIRGRSLGPAEESSISNATIVSLHA